MELFRSRDDAALDVAGTSPLTIDVPPDALRRAGDHYAIARPATPGATVDQKVTYVLTLEYA